MRRIDLEAWHGRCLFVLFAWAALAIGSARPFAVAVTTILAAVTFTVGRLERGVARHGSRLDGVSIVLLLLTAFTFLQLVPLPPSTVRFLSPRAFELHDAALVPLGVPHRDGWFPLSLDPPATALAALAMLAVSLTYLTVRQRLRSHGGRSVLGPIVAAGVAVAIVFFLHRLAGWTKVYDEYLPRYAPAAPLAAPFLNPNHLAGALGFAATLSFGLALSSVDRFRRLTLITAGAMTGGACLLTLSRGGVIGFVAGQLLFVVLRFAARRSEGREEARAAAERSRSGVRAATSSVAPAAEGVPGENASAREAVATGTEAGTGNSGASGAGREDESGGRRRHSPRESRDLHLAWASLGAVLAIVAGSYVAYGAIRAEFEHGDASKLEIARDALTMTGDYPVAGIGRGAFLAAYPPYQTQDDRWTYTHPENIVAQYVVEWGVPLGGLALLGLLFVLGRAAMRPPLKAHNAAAIAAVFALLLQNVVDFGLELLGLALPFVAALAVVRETGAVGDARRTQRPSHPRLRLPGPAWMAAVAGTIAAVALLYPWAAANDLAVESDRFRLYAADKQYHPGMLDDAREAFARHPADYYLPFLAGIHLARAGHGSPIAFWNQALRLRPCSSMAHFAVASYLSRMPAHRSQSIEEYGQAVRCRPGALEQATAAVARLTTGLPGIDGSTDNDAFVRLAAGDPGPYAGASEAATDFERRRVEVWDAMGSAYERIGKGAAAAVVDARLLERDAGHAAARFRRARAALDAGDAQGALAQLARIPDDAAASSSAWYLLQARARQDQGRIAEAVAVLEDGLGALRTPDIPVALSELYAGTGDYEAAARALSALETRARTQQERSDAVARRVQLLIRAGHPADALQQTRRALGIDPGRLDLWRLAADLAEQLGDTPGAVWALRELVRRNPQDGGLRDRLREAETHATQVRLLSPP
ncbi:MAG: tetratricopeptide repeat protein [Deltaproteobacteria bacterium]|nr:tetratricopeptide repeat protein [Deltaproteobacteria bacterium]